MSDSATDSSVSQTDASSKNCIVDDDPTTNLAEDTCNAGDSDKSTQATAEPSRIEPKHSRRSRFIFWFLFFLAVFAVGLLSTPQLRLSSEERLEIEVETGSITIDLEGLIDKNQWDLDDNVEVCTRPSYEDPKWSCANGPAALGGTRVAFRVGSPTPAYVWAEGGALVVSLHSGDPLFSNCPGQAMSYPCHAYVAGKAFVKPLLLRFPDDRTLFIKGKMRLGDRSNDQSSRPLRKGKVSFHGHGWHRGAEPDTLISSTKIPKLSVVSVADDEGRRAIVSGTISASENLIEASLQDIERPSFGWVIRQGPNGHEGTAFASTAEMGELVRPNFFDRVVALSYLSYFSAAFTLLALFLQIFGTSLVDLFRKNKELD